MHEVMQFKNIAALLSISARRLAACLCLGGLSLFGADTCALTLQLFSYDGRPASNAWVELRDSEDKVVLRTLMEGPTLRICDFGFGPHSLRVGASWGLPVTVSNLRLLLKAPLNIKVVLNSTNYTGGMGSGCLLYLRVADRAGQPVPGADILQSNFPGTSAKADSFGRYQALYGGTNEIVVRKEGYEDSRTVVACKDREQLDRGVVITRIGEK